MQSSARLFPLALALLVAPACGDSLAPFPTAFKWGTATSPYQVEGGLHENDWHQWESTTANEAMQRADDGPGQYTRFDEDAQHAEALGTNAVRFGIDWSRIFPTEASFPNSPDAVAVAHYHAVLASFKTHGQHPMVTLYHWVFPLWIQDLDHLAEKNGWMDPAIVARFSTFAGWAAKEFGAEVDLWITLNEPTVNLAAGYLTANHPPLRTFGDTDGIANAGMAARNMIRAHAAAYDAIHAADTVDADGDGDAAQVSCAFHLRLFEPFTFDSEIDLEAARRIHYISNELFLNALVDGDLDGDFDGSLDGDKDVKADPTLAHRLDYLGLNYYGVSQVVGFGASAVGPVPGLISSVRLGDDRPKSEFGWSLYPEGFRKVLDEAAAYKLPIYITENGIADASETLRPRFIVEHLRVLQQAISDGIDVRGYYHWSLIDNFEWGGGYCPRFGLYRVDFDDPARPRTLGRGGEIYRDIIRARAVAPSWLETLPPYTTPAQFCKGGG